MKYKDESPKKSEIVGNHAKEKQKGSRMELTFISEPRNAHLKMLTHKSRAAEFVLYPGFRCPSSSSSRIREASIRAETQG